MLTKGNVFFLMCFLIISPEVAMSAEGRMSNSLNTERLNQAVEEFVQRTIQHYLIKTCGEVMQELVVGSKVQLFPELALQASHQAAVQLFKQEDMKNLIWGIFDESAAQAKDEVALGMPQGYIETGIKKRVERDVRLIIDDPIFRYVIESMLNQAMIQQQKIVMMTVAQQQAQLLAIRQQQMVLQQMVMQQVMQHMIENQLR